MSEIIDRLKDFEDHCIETNNPEGAEVLHHAAERIKELEAMLSKNLDWIKCGIGVNCSGDPYENPKYIEAKELLSE